MPSFFDRLFRRQDPDAIFDDLAEVQAAIDRGEDVSDRVVMTGSGTVDRTPFAELIGPLERTAYLPQTSDHAFGAGSGFGGSPFLPPGLDHPTCPNCHQAMPLLAQLDMATLPVSVRPPGEGLIQAFYCDNAPSDDPGVMPCDVELEGWAPFSRASVVRLVPAGSGIASTSHRAHPARRIEGWEARQGDLPTWDEAAELGITYPDELADDEDGFAKTGDKLGGWPAWVQSVEYPDCPRCGTRMAYVLQIDSEDHVPVMFGDVGTGHVTQCPQHPDVLAFGWACS